MFIRNPNALHPLPEGWLGAGAEEVLAPTGTVIPNFADPFHVYSSDTILFRGDVSDDALWTAINQRVGRMRMGQMLGAQWRS